MLTLITGGVKNGKSKFGEDLCTQANAGQLLYIATMYRNPDDIEISRRIERHRQMRLNNGFDTLEKYTGLKDLHTAGYSSALLECLPNLLANEMFLEHRTAEDSENEIISGVMTLRSTLDNLIVITNEVFSDGYKYSLETLAYIRALGRLNSKLTEISERVYEVVCGIPIRLK